MAAYRRVDDLQSPAGWLSVHRDQLRAQRSVSSMGSLYLFTMRRCVPRSRSSRLFALVDVRRLRIVRIASWWSAAACTADLWSAEWSEWRCRDTVSLATPSTSPAAWSPPENVRTRHQRAAIFHTSSFFSRRAGQLCKESVLSASLLYTVSKTSDFHMRRPISVIW